MNRWIAFWSILLKDMRAYYFKPPNISWGLLFPFAWAAMFFIKTGRGLDSAISLLPGQRSSHRTYRHCHTHPAP